MFQEKKEEVNRIVSNIKTEDGVSAKEDITPIPDFDDGEKTPTERNSGSYLCDDTPIPASTENTAESSRHINVENTTVNLALQCNITVRKNKDYKKIIRTTDGQTTSTSDDELNKDGHDVLKREDPKPREQPLHYSVIDSAGDSPPIETAAIDIPGCRTRHSSDPIRLNSESGSLELPSSHSPPIHTRVNLKEHLVVSTYTGTPQRSKAEVSISAPDM